MGDSRLESEQDVARAAALAQLIGLATARWGADYVAEHTALLGQAAGYVAHIGRNLPEPEREPGFYQ